MLDDSQSGEKLILMAEVAGILGVSTRHAKRLIREAGLPTLKLSDAPRARVRIRKTELDAWIQARSEAGGE